MVNFILDLTVVSALWEKSTVFEFVNMPQERRPSSPSGENVDHSKLLPYSYTCSPHAASRSRSSTPESFEVYGCEWLTPERIVVISSTDVELLSCNVCFHF